MPLNDAARIRERLDLVEYFLKETTLRQHLVQKIRLSGSDLIHVVCEQCGRKEVCPSNLRGDRDDDSTIAAAESAAHSPTARSS